MAMESATTMADVLRLAAVDFLRAHPDFPPQEAVYAARILESILRYMADGQIHAPDIKGQEERGVQMKDPLPSVEESSLFNDLPDVLNDTRVLHNRERDADLRPG